MENFDESLKVIENVLKDYCKASGCSKDCDNCELPKTLNRVVKAQAPKYELVEVIIGEPTPCLFVPERVEKGTLPDGLYAYELRDDGLGNYEESTLEIKVLVNFAGTLVFCDYIGIAENGPYHFTEDTSPNFTGEELTYDEFLERFS